MTKSEERAKLAKRAKDLVEELMPGSDRMEFRASIGDTSYSVEFFVWVNGEKLQCYELSDSGRIDELKMEKLFEAYAEFVRKSEGYRAGEVNKIHFAG
jgi:hypothetical protein